MAVICWIIIGIIFIPLLVWGVILQLPKTRGWAMEKFVAAVLSRLPKKDYIVINNLFFRTGRSTCQIDHLVISRYGIFVIETKNYLGVIAGKGSHKLLRRKVLGMKYKTRNPIDQNEWHTRYLIDHFPLISEHRDALIPLVVFNFSSFPKITNAPCPVCKIQNLLKTIKSYKSQIISQDLTLQIKEQIQLQNRNK